MKRSEIYAYTGTAVVALVILLILLLVVMPGRQLVPEDDGVMISFGEFTDGGGMAPTPTQNVASEAVPVPAKEEKLITQTDPSVSMTETKQKTEATKASQVDAREQLRKEQEALQKADDLIGGSFGSSGDAGSGRTSSDVTAGNPVGSGSSGGNSWSLSGRNLLGSMPTPRYDQNEEGMITVEIRVNAAGQVVAATVSRPTTISNPALQKSSIAAARQTRFSSGNGVAVGTITYNFKLR
ncbi:MAG: energy transducer TonB [Paludibacter sp.]|jgi:TonB family protein|nr:energy transducer TonB [Paludibacter sp.]